VVKEPCFRKPERAARRPLRLVARRARQRACGPDPFVAFSLRSVMSLPQGVDVATVKR
jgi:hypothetical protein